MKLPERIIAFILVLAISIISCSCAGTETEPASSAVPTEDVSASVEPDSGLAPVVEDIKLMFYTTEIETEFTAMVGEKVELWADVICESTDKPQVEWKVSDENSLRLEYAEGSKEVSLTVLSAEKGDAALTLSCNGFEKEYTVHIQAVPGEVSIPGMGELVVKDIELMYFNTELDEFTVKVGETVGLRADVIYEGKLEEQPIWKSSNENCLMIECDPSGSYGANISCLSADESPVTLTISCGGFEKDFTVYLYPGQ